MRILLVKTSSLGDVIHNLPVASDILRCHPEAVIDWCVEAPFSPLVRLHPGIDRVIPVAVRHWRRHLLAADTWRQIGTFRRELQAVPYDLILDSQGLLKSALIARTGRGPCHGYDAASAREPLASRCYHATHPVPRPLHAVTRNRQLAAQALGYAAALAQLPLDYGIAAPTPEAAGLPESYGVLLTATSRADKLWPEAHWITLGQQLAACGIASVLPAGSPAEHERARRIAAAIPGAQALPRQGLASLAGVLGQARLVVGVDTGLTHLAAALKRPVAALYTTTDPQLTGVLSAGTYENLGGRGHTPAPDEVWASCQRLLPALKA